MKAHKALYAGRGQAADVDRSRLTWWKEARFGLFIHWGLYAIPAGFWGDKNVQGLGEWIMYNGKIPVSDYEKLAEQFNPVNFDAHELVSQAKRFGMRYLVITAKHHDGFAMFASPSNRYNVADATPYGRDIIGELAAACHSAGLPIGFYYSQDQDWHDPDGSWNDWDFDESEKVFERYFRRKVVPQVTELLTQYGPVGLIWFDTPYTMSAEYSMELRQLVHRLQPECLVSGRVGNDLGDYGSLGDNQIPVGPVDGDYETPATLNDTWGYRKDDENWKSGEQLIYLLIDLASKGINYLLNIGPMADGSVPEESLKRLEIVGSWLAVNGDAIYGCEANPFPWEFEWGRITVGHRKMYLIFFEWPSQPFILYGVRSHVVSATTNTGIKLSVHQERDDSLDHHSLTVSGFGAESPGLFPVVTLEVQEELEVDDRLLQQPDGTVRIPAFTGTFVDRSGKPLGVDAAVGVSKAGFTDEWTDTDVELAFTFLITAPGRFDVAVLSAAAVASDTGVDRPEVIAIEPHEVGIEISTEHNHDASVGSLRGLLSGENRTDAPRSQYFPEIVSRIGSVELSEVGLYTARLNALHITDSHELQVSAVVMTAK